MPLNQVVPRKYNNLRVIKLNNLKWRLDKHSSNQSHIQYIIYSNVNGEHCSVKYELCKLNIELRMLNTDKTKHAEYWASGVEHWQNKTCWILSFGCWTLTKQNILNIELRILKLFFALKGNIYMSITRRLSRLYQQNVYFCWFLCAACLSASYVFMSQFTNYMCNGTAVYMSSWVWTINAFLNSIQR
jgi:hypothetical protein